MLTAMERANGRSDLAKSYLQEADKNLSRYLAIEICIFCFIMPVSRFMKAIYISARKYAAGML